MLKGSRIFACFFMFASVGAQAAEKTKFRIAHNVLSYASKSVEMKPDTGASTEAKETSLSTFSGGWELYVSMGKANIYVMPGQAGSAVTAGYSLSKALEAGVTLKLLSNSVDKPKSESSTTEFGFYAVYYLALSKTATLELSFSPIFGSGSGETTTVDATGASTTTKSSLSMSQFNFGAGFAYEITDNFHYFASLGYSMDSRKDSEAKMSTSTGTLALNLAGLRYWL